MKRAVKMKKKAFFIIFKGLLLKQIYIYIYIYIEGESPILSDIEQVGLSVAHLMYRGSLYTKLSYVYVYKFFLKQVLFQAGI